MRLALNLLADLAEAICLAFLVAAIACASLALYP